MSSRPERISQMLLGPEGEQSEKTQSLTDSDKFGRAICAFANDMAGTGLPGYLFVGRDPSGRATRPTIDEKSLEHLASLRDNGNILPLPDMSVFAHDAPGGQVAVVEVRPSDMPPVRYKGDVWIRTGPSQDRATPEQERRLEERRVDRARTWDCRACPGSSTDDLALEIFTLGYLPKAVSPDVIRENGRSLEEQLGSLRLFNRQVARPTNGAILLFGKDPLQFFPGAYVQYVRYSGTTQETPVGERRLTGDLYTVLREADHLARQLENSRPVRQPDLSESLAADYPALALHEFFVNAIIHRNYDGSTSPVMINHYADRVEVQNAGGLYGDLSPANFPGLGSYRNPLLAEATKILGHANRFGSGIARAQAVLAKNASPPALLEPRDSHFLVTIRIRP